MRIIIERNLEEKIKRFNTPNTKNINTIFSETLGIEKIISRLSNKNIDTIINTVLQIRHSIAHTGKSAIQLNLNNNFNYMGLLFEAAEELEEIVAQEI